MQKNRTMQIVKVKNYTPSFNEIWKRYADITKNIAFSIAIDLFPISSPEMKDLKDVLKVLEPFYQFPSEKQLLEVIIPQLYDQVKKKMTLTIKEDLSKGVNRIALTIDGWTCRSIADHMTVAVHYWTEDFVPRHYLLQLESLPKKWNTAQDLFHLVQNVLLKYGFSEEKTTIHIVTANGQNIVKAISLNDKWIRIPCFARLLQLTVDDVLRNFNNFNSLVPKCQHLVAALWSKASIESEANKSVHSSSILDDIVPSWNSIFEMFDNLLKLRTTLDAFLKELPSTPEILTESDWETISCYVQVFSLLKQASKLMSEEVYPPLSLYLPTIRGILELMESMNLNNQLSMQLIRSICSRFGHINTNESMIIAMVVDPRFKTRLLSDDEKFTVFDIVKSKMLSINSNTTVISETDKIKNPSVTPLELYFMNIKKQENPTSNTCEKIAEAELTYYLYENVVSMDTAIHEWWKDNSKRFPKLCELAKIYLSIPAVQVSTERAFPNKQGFNIDTRAEILTNQTNVLDLMRISFLHSNLGKFETDICL